jgi:hypothetical protein
MTAGPSFGRIVAPRPVAGRPQPRVGGGWCERGSTRTIFTQPKSVCSGRSSRAPRYWNRRRSQSRVATTRCRLTTSTPSCGRRDGLRSPFLGPDGQTPLAEPPVASHGARLSPLDAWLALRPARHADRATAMLSPANPPLAGRDSSLLSCADAAPRFGDD